MSEYKEVNELFATFKLKVEKASQQGEPLMLTKEDVIGLRQKFKEIGVDYDIGDEQKASLLNGIRMRSRVLVGDGEVKGVEIYDRRLPEGSRWILHSRDEHYPPEAFKDEIGVLVDKTYGMRAALGPEGFEKTIIACYEIAAHVGYNKIIGGNPGTKGRGLQEIASDLLAVTFALEEDDFESNLVKITNNINKRLWKGHPESSSLDNTFKSAGIESPGKTIASAPQGTVNLLVEKMTTR